MKQNIWCKIFNLHKYNIFREETLTNRHGDVVGTVIISRCANCGKITHTIIYTEDGYERH